jgi:hypothetical protein
MLAIKATRSVVVIAVSLWMAGGCLFGCSSNAMGAEVSQSMSAVPTASHHVVAHHGCHAAHSISPAEGSGPTQAGNAAPAGSAVRTRSAALAGVPHGMNGECPLAMSATAVASKKSTNAPEQARSQVAALPKMESGAELTHPTFEISFLPNRGPTHLRCCVFRI